MDQESVIITRLFDSFPFATIEDTSGCPGSMDIRIELPSICDFQKKIIYIESKNIKTTNVSGPELQKFERDFCSLSDADAAIIIARRSVDVRNGYSTQVDRVPNLSRANRRQYYVDRADLNALVIAIFIIWASDLPKSLERGDIHPAVNRMIKMASASLEAQKKLISTIFRPIRLFMDTWYCQTRSLVQSLVDLREHSDGFIQVEKMIGAINYKTMNGCCKRKPSGILNDRSVSN